MWSDGTPLNFVNWAGGEPNNANGGENCVEMLASNSKKRFNKKDNPLLISCFFLKAYGMVLY